MITRTTKGPHRKERGCRRKVIILITWGVSINLYMSLSRGLLTMYRSRRQEKKFGTSSNHSETIPSNLVITTMSKRTKDMAQTSTRDEPGYDLPIPFFSFNLQLTVAEW